MESSTLILDRLQLVLTVSLLHHITYLINDIEHIYQRTVSMINFENIFRALITHMFIFIIVEYPKAIELHPYVILTSHASHYVTLIACLLLSEPDCQFVWEKKPTPEEEEKAKSLQLPSTFFCGLSTTDSDPDHDKLEDFETEVLKAQQDMVHGTF